MYLARDPLNTAVSLVETATRRQPVECDAVQRHERAGKFFDPAVARPPTSDLGGRRGRTWQIREHGGGITQKVAARVGEESPWRPPEDWSDRFEETLLAVEAVGRAGRLPSAVLMKDKTLGGAAGKANVEPIRRRVEATDERDGFEIDDVLAEGSRYPRDLSRR
jgi:hypothetical protein